MVEEKIKLSKEQAKEFIEQFKMGDIMGLQRLQEIITNELKIKRNDMIEDIYDVIAFTVYLNTMVAHGETFEGVCSDHYDKIYELYDIMKTELFSYFDNEEDFEKYWNE